MPGARPQMQSVVCADSEKDVHFTQLAERAIGFFLLLLAAAVPYGWRAVQCGFQLFFYIVVDPDLFLQWSSDARGTTPNAWCCVFADSEKGVHLTQLANGKVANGFCSCFWQQYFHTAARRFDLDSSWLLIFLYSQTCLFAREFGCQGHDPKCKVLLVQTKRLTFS